MKKQSQLILCLSLLIFCSLFTVSAQDNNNELEKQISALITSGTDQNDNPGLTLRVRLLTPAAQLANLCRQPHLSLTASSRLIGQRSVVAQCGTTRRFIQIYVEAEGTWWVAARDLVAGSVLSASDFVARSGSLENLPAGLIVNPQQINGMILTRNLRASHPLTQSLLRQPWRVTVGQEVEVFAAGDGFQIRTRGKTLDNGAVNDNVRIRMKSGQLVTGRVNADGSVTLAAK